MIILAVTSKVSIRISVDDSVIDPLFALHVVIAGIFEPYGCTSCQL